MPGGLELYAYLVHPGDVDVTILADRLTASVQAALADSPLRAYSVTVEGLRIAAGATTPPDSVVAVVAGEEWQRANDEVLPVITGWTGSTDGVILRAAGIDTVRTGPTAALSADGVNDLVSVTELVTVEDVYEQILRRLSTESDLEQ
jgi:acetylornithine deacetylase/succinyl-diaminopimelate desuccinylase-like protein